MSRELQRIAPPPQTDGSTLYPCGCNADRIEGSTCGHCGREILGVQHRQTVSRAQLDQFTDRMRHTPLPPHA